MRIEINNESGNEPTLEQAQYACTVTREMLRQQIPSFASANIEGVTAIAKMMEYGGVEVIVSGPDED